LLKLNVPIVEGQTEDNVVLATRPCTYIENAPKIKPAS